MNKHSDINSRLNLQYVLCRQYIFDALCSAGRRKEFISYSNGLKQSYISRARASISQSDERIMSERKRRVNL